jgi:O-antigen/teichoic acid export membrane protein
VTAPAEASSRGLGDRWGFLSVAVGLGVYGLASYAYLTVSGRALGVALFAPLSVLWTLLNAVGIGLFLPLEQELGRTTASLRARRRGNGPAVRAVLATGGALLAGVAVVCLVAWPALEARLFHGHAVLVPLLVGGLAGMAVAYAARGLLAGNSRYPAYGAQLAVDGVLRVGGAGLLAVLGVREVGAYALVLVLAPLLSVLVTTRRAGLVAPGEATDAVGLRRAVVALVLASLASQLLANVGPIIVQLRAAPDEQVLTAQFTAALTVARVPVFMFAAVQAVLLPGLAALRGAGDLAGFRRRLGLVTAVTAGLAAAGTLAVWAWGDALVPLLFGDAFSVASVGRGAVTLIALSGGLFMLAQVAAQALLALSGDRAVGTGWGVGLVALVLTAVVPGPVTTVAAVALVVGSAVALLALAVPLLARLRVAAATEVDHV